MNFKKGLSYLFEKKTTAAAAFLIALIGLAIYANSLTGQFIWDDNFLVRDNLYIRSCSNLAEIFTTGLGAGSGKDFQYYYRPLHIASYIADYSIWKLNVIGYHLTNILLHILVALCVYWFILLLYDDKRLSFLTSIFFLVHPIQVESVASISVRGDLLSALFILLSFIFYIKLLRTNKISLYVLILLSYILALLSKENGLVLPALLLLYHYIFKKKINLRIFALILITAIAYILFRSAILKPTSLWIVTIPERIPGFFVAITNYVRLLLFPFNLHAEYGKQLFNFINPRAIIGIAITLFLLAYSFRKRNGGAIIFFSICWFFITLLPVSNIYPIAFYMSEHYLYLPSMGFYLLLAYGISNLLNTKSFRIITTAFVVILVIFYSYLAIIQNNYWKNPLVFYKKTLKYTPDSPRINNNLGVIYNQMMAYDKAIIVLTKAVAGDPYYAEAYTNLGVSFSGLGRREDAIKAYETSIELDPAYREAYYNLGNLYYRAGDKIKAIDLYKKALGLDPNFTDAYFNLGVANNDIGRQEEAINSFIRVVEIDPEYAPAYRDLARIYFKTKQYDLAVKYYDKARELGVSDPALLKGLEPYRK